MAIRVSGGANKWKVYFSIKGKFLLRVGQWGIRDSVGLDLLNCYLFRFMWSLEFAKCSKHTQKAVKIRNTRLFRLIYCHFFKDSLSEKWKFVTLLCHEIAFLLFFSNWSFPIRAVLKIAGFQSENIDAQKKKESL